MFQTRHLHSQYKTPQALTNARTPEVDNHCRFCSHSHKKRRKNEKEKKDSFFLLLCLNRVSAQRAQSWVMLECDIGWVSVRSAPSWALAHHFFTSWTSGTSGEHLKAVNYSSVSSMFAREPPHASTYAEKTFGTSLKPGWPFSFSLWKKYRRESWIGSGRILPL